MHLRLHRVTFQLPSDLVEAAPVWVSDGPGLTSDVCMYTCMLTGISRMKPGDSGGQHTEAQKLTYCTV